MDSTNLTDVGDISSFGYSLFSVLAAAAPESNILISPYSIASALALGLAGATMGSLCQKEMHKTLGISSHAQLPALSEKLVGSTDGNPFVTLTTANGIWSRDIKTSFIDTIKNTHGAEAGDMPDTFGPIDEFIKKNTNGIIPNMLGNGPIDKMIMALLVNAVYFKGEWTTPFDEKNTEVGSFLTFDGKEHDAKFMHFTETIPVATNVKQLNGAHIVKLEYGKQKKNPKTGALLESDFSALFVLPAKKGKEAMDRVIKNLTTSMRKSSLGSVMDQMKQFRKVELSLPRFKVEYGVKSLKAELQSLGMKEAFIEKEGLFDEISDDQHLFISEVAHKALMEVTEEGTEAAAATVIMVRTTSLPPPPFQIRFDRPFLMIVLHQPTSTPLFIAQIAIPESPGNGIIASQTTSSFFHDVRRTIMKPFFFMSSLLLCIIAGKKFNGVHENRYCSNIRVGNEKIS